MNSCLLLWHLQPHGTPQLLLSRCDLWKNIAPLMKTYLWMDIMGKSPESGEDNVAEESRWEKSAKPNKTGGRAEYHCWLKSARDAKWTEQVSNIILTGDEDKHGESVLLQHHCSEGQPICRFPSLSISEWGTASLQQFCDPQRSGTTVRDDCINEAISIT